MCTWTTPCKDGCVIGNVYCMLTTEVGKCVMKALPSR